VNDEKQNSYERGPSAKTEKSRKDNHGLAEIDQGGKTDAWSSDILKIETHENGNHGGQRCDIRRPVVETGAEKDYAEKGAGNHGDGDNHDAHPLAAEDRRSRRDEYHHAEYDDVHNEEKKSLPFDDV